MKKFLVVLLSVIVLIIIVYFAGPRVDAPTFSSAEISLPESLTDLDNMINEEERATKGIKPDNQARIVWADSTKQKTKVAFLYLHGFTSTQGDGLPVHTMIAKSFGANLYLFRNAHHGVDLGDSTMIDAKADDYIQAAERALAITKKLGDEVVVMGTSFGGGLALYLASTHPEIKAIVLYAPAVTFDNSQAKLVTGPWGYQLAKMSTGSEYINNPDTVKSHQKYWQMHVHLNGLVSVISAVDHSQSEETFARIKCPAFLGYYYKDETHQDDAIGVKSMQKMFDLLGTPPAQKKQVMFPEAGDHVIASELISGEWMNVERETEKWLREVVLTSL